MKLRRLFSRKIVFNLILILFIATLLIFIILASGERNRKDHLHQSINNLSDSLYDLGLVGFPVYEWCQEWSLNKLGFSEASCIIGVESGGSYHGTVSENTINKEAFKFINSVKDQRAFTIIKEYRDNKPELDYSYEALYENTKTGSECKLEITFDQNKSVLFRSFYCDDTPRFFLTF
jgi:hypothetical protein